MNKPSLKKGIFSVLISIFLILNSIIPAFAESDIASEDNNFVLDDINMYWDIFKVVKQGLIKDYEMISFEPIQVVDKLLEKTIIKTKLKSTILVLINGLSNHNSYIQLSENAELHVLSLKKTDTGELLDCRLEIPAGEMIINIENLPSTSNFSVKTPFSEATVKGTFLGVNVRPSKVADWAVLRGKITVKHNNQNHQGKNVAGGEGLQDGASALGDVGAAQKAFLERMKKKAKEAEKDVKKYAKKKQNAAKKARKEKKKGPDDDDNGPGNEGGPKTGIDPNLGNNLLNNIINPPINVLPIPMPPSSEFKITTATNWPNATEGHLYTKQLTAEGGSKPYSWALIAITHPEDKHIGTDNDSTDPKLSSEGVFSGTPPGDSASTVPHKLLIEVKDSSGKKLSKEFFLKVSGYTESDGWNAIIATGETGATDNNGFGSILNESIPASTVFNGYIYMGTENNGGSGGGAQVWRSANGATWTQSGTNGIGNVSNDEINSFAVFNNALYAGTTNTASEGGTAGGQIWKTVNGTTWIQTLDIGGGELAGDTDNTVITDLEVFTPQGTNTPLLFLATYCANANGGEVWVSADGDNWTQSGADGLGTSNNQAIQKLAVFNGYLYATTWNTTGCFVYRTGNGTIWTEVVGSGSTTPSGFGNVDNTIGAQLWHFDGYLYVGTGNSPDGCEIWRSNDGTTWERVVDAGFDNISNKNVYSVTIFNNWIYVGTANSTDGGQVFRSADGFNWDEVGTTTYWDTGNSAISTLIPFSGWLYAGTSNSNTFGAEVWRLESVYLDPPIAGRVYDQSTGETISSAVVSIHQYNYNNNTSNLIASTTNNPYRFNVNDGLYFLRVEAEGYTFPSTTAKSVTSGDLGEVFVAEGNDLMTIDLPVEQGYPLEVIKTANKNQVVIGDIVTFNISIRNKSTADVSNILIHDNITNGFKMVEGSTYLGTQLQSDPQTSNRNLTFPISTVPGGQTLNLSYVTRVGVGMEAGRFETTAFAWSNIHDWRLSNDSICEIDVIPDPLFTEGTIIGKVFADTNKNGIQDKGEKGISKAKLVSPKGMIITTDEDGKFHIAGVLPGIHSLKLDCRQLTIDHELKETEKYIVTTENPRVVNVTEALPVKMNFGVLLEQTLTNPTEQSGNESTKQLKNQTTSQPENNQFFITALGDITAKQLSTSHNIEMVNNSDKYDRKFKVDGGLAVYLKGKVKGKYLITASFDSERAPAEYGNSVFKNKLFRNLDPDKYYPVYGDKSEINYDALNTQDELFLLVEWDQSKFSWGSFNTEIPLYNRTLHGANIIYKSLAKTKFGEDKTQINTFAARAFSASAHDEILATGGSLYYIAENGIIEGSEKIKVAIKDPVTQEEISSYPLIEERDYEIDYDQGRVLLKKPLSANSFSYNQSIIFNDISRSAVVYLVVDYEYKVFESLRKEALGTKVNQAIGDHLTVGGTYVQHEKKTDDYQLQGTNATYRLNESTYLTTQYDQTKETQMTNNTSITGGLDNTKLSDKISDGKKGHSLSIMGETKLFDNTQVKTSYSKQDTDFSATGNTSLTGTTSYNGQFITTLKPNLKVGLTHAVQETASQTSASLGADNKVQTTTAMADLVQDKWDFRLEQQHQEILHKTNDFTWQGTRQLLDHDITGIRAGYKLTEEAKIYAGGQVSVSGFDNNQGFVGTNLTVDNDTNVSFQETIGNKGEATNITLSKKIGLSSSKDLSISSGSDEIGKYSKISQSVSSPLSDDTNIYVKQDYSTYQSRMLAGNSVGSETKLSDTLTSNIFYERSHALDEPTAINRTALGGGLKFSDEEITASSQLEVIKDDGSSDRIQFTTQNQMFWQISNEYETTFKLNYSTTENQANDMIEAKFLELGSGLSYRPVDLDKLNILSKYSCIIDQNPVNRGDFAQSYRDFRHVFALEGIYDLNQDFQLVFKTAYRFLQEKVYPRDWIKSNTYLYLIRLNYHLLHHYDAGLEYRILANQQIEDKKQGFLLEIDRHLGNNFKLGIGYNFTDYSDDLRDNDKYDARGFFIRAIGKY